MITCEEPQCQWRTKTMQLATESAELRTILRRCRVWLPETRDVEDPDEKDDLIDLRNRLRSALAIR